MSVRVCCLILNWWHWSPRTACSKSKAKKTTNYLCLVIVKEIYITTSQKINYGWQSMWLLSGANFSRRSETLHVEKILLIWHFWVEVTIKNFTQLKHHVFTIKIGDFFAFAQTHTHTHMTKKIAFNPLNFNGYNGTNFWETCQMFTTPSQIQFGHRQWHCLPFIVGHAKYIPS